MTKTTCDICGKVMPTDFYPASIDELHFCISSCGKIWDICDKCRDEIGKLIENRRKEMSKNHKSESEE